MKSSSNQWIGSLVWWHSTISVVSVAQDGGCQTRFLSALGRLEHSIERCQAEAHLALLPDTWDISGQLVKFHHFGCCPCGRETESWVSRSVNINCYLKRNLGVTETCLNWTTFTVPVIQTTQVLVLNETCLQQMKVRSLAVPFYAGFTVY